MVSVQYAAAPFPPLRPGLPAQFIGSWSNATTYAFGDAVRALDGSTWKLYVSLRNGSLNNDPVGGSVWWLDVIAGGDPVIVQGAADPNSFGEVNRIMHFTQNATGGTFDMVDGLGSVNNIAWNATEATIQTAFDSALGGGPGRVVVTGNAADFTLEYYGPTDPYDMDGSSLTGGGVTLEETTQAQVTGGFASYATTVFLQRNSSGEAAVWWYDEEEVSWSHEAINVMDSGANENQNQRSGVSLTRSGKGTGDATVANNANRTGIGDGNAVVTISTNRAGTGSGVAEVRMQAQHYTTGTVVMGPYADEDRAFNLFKGDALFRSSNNSPRNVYQDSDEEVTDTTLAASGNLTVNLDAGRRYKFKFTLFTLNDGAAEGIKVAVNTTDSLTATALKAQISIYDDVLNTLVAFARVTALNSSVGAGMSSGVGFAVIEGSIQVNAAGTFALTFAQNAAGINAGVHIEVGSSLEIICLE